MSKIKLNKIDTAPPEWIDKKDIKKQNEELIAQIADLQTLMFAENKHSVLIVLQWLDASWKDGVIKHICQWLNPQWIHVVWFKQPTQEEQDHDFLWRIHKHVPDRGTITIFNRSHYEDIIMPLVHKTHPKSQIEKRYQHINNFEQMLEDEWITILKFYLHVGEEAQLDRLKERMTDPKKMRKYNEWDRTKREARKDTIEWLESVINECDVIPRHIIPSDENRYKVNQIAKIIVKKLTKLDMKWPQLVTTNTESED